MDDELVSLGKELERRLANWRLLPGVSREEVVCETLVRYWRSQRNSARDIQQSAISWLMGTAKNVMRELSRQVSKATPMTDVTMPCTQATGHRTESDGLFDSSEVWHRFSPQQRHILEEAIMFDRPVAEVAAEVNVNRSTAKSWIKRLPKRLAKDQALQTYLAENTALHENTLAGDQTCH